MRFVAAGMALVLALALGGCTVSVTGHATPAADVFVDAQGRFGIVAPTGWSTDTSGQQRTTVLFLDTAAAEPFTANINVLVLPAGAGLPATVAGARQELRGLAGYTSTADEPAVLADGTPAHLLGGTFTGSGHGLRNVQLLTVHDGSTIVVTGTALADSWGRYGSAFDASLRTLTVTP